MSVQQTITAFAPLSRKITLSGSLAPLSDYWALTKPEVNFLILITTLLGFYLGCGSEAQPFSLFGLFNTFFVFALIFFKGVYSEHWLIG